MSAGADRPLAKAGLRRTIGLAARAGGGSFYATIAAMSGTGLGFAVVLFLGRDLVQRLTAEGGPVLDGTTWLLLAAAVLTAGLIAFGQLASSGLHRLLAERVMFWVNEQITLVTADSEMRDFDTPAFHDRIRRARNGANSSIQIAIAAPMLVAALVTSLGLIVAVGATAPVLIPVALLSGVPLLLAGRANGEEMYSFSFGNTPNDRERFQLEGILSSRDQAAEVRVFGIEDFLVRRWRTLYHERLDGLAVLVRGFVRRSAVAAVGVAISLVLVLASLVWLLTSGHIDVLAAATAGVSVILLSDQAQKIAGNAGQLREQTVQVADFYETLQLRHARANRELKPTAGPLETMTAEHLTFTYPSGDEPALRDVSFDLRGDEMVAIVGHNGSGKTTLAKMLCGLYAADSGAVCWNGVPVRDLDPGRQIGAVFQTFARYWFSARDNIAVGAVADGREPDETEVRRAAAEAGADEFLEHLPRGYDSMLAVELDGGVDLSLGQWQRVAIARVLYRAPSFVVLDEPTASLDAEGEAALFETLSRMRSGRTVVMISHRFSTVRSADRILVMDHGRLIEQGSHDELMALGGTYARMYALQAAAYV